MASNQLMGVTEVATKLGISRQRVTQLADSPGFPQPVAVLASGRIWEAGDLDLWLQLDRLGRSGRPRRAHRIEYGGINEEGLRAFVVGLEVRADADSSGDSTFQRMFERTMGAYVLEQLNSQMPPEQAKLSLYRAMAGLATRQLAQEIDDAGDFGVVLNVAQMTHRWFQYLPNVASGIRHPIPDLREGEVLHLWPGTVPGTPDVLAETFSEYVHLECGHWTNRARVTGEVSVYLSEATCPTCGGQGRVVGLWPQR
jgi:prophage regulatory protein